MILKAVIHEAAEGGFWAEVPALPGCVTQGESMEELDQDFRMSDHAHDAGKHEVGNRDSGRLLQPGFQPWPHRVVQLRVLPERRVNGFEITTSRNVGNPNQQLNQLREQDIANAGGLELDELKQTYKPFLQRCAAGRELPPVGLRSMWRMAHRPPHPCSPSKASFQPRNRVKSTPVSTAFASQVPLRHREASPSSTAPHDPRIQTEISTDLQEWLPIEVSDFSTGAGVIESSVLGATVRFYRFSRT
jgi:hypothetical protein